MSDLQILMDMGFPKARAEKALQLTNNKGIEPAMDWLLAHADEKIEDLPSEDLNVLAQNVIADDENMDVVSAASHSVESALAPAVEETSTITSSTAAASTVDNNEAMIITQDAKSYKCDECGRLCKDQTEMEFHIGRTNHTHFSESTEEKKPLTENEKKEQLLKIEEKLKQKRVEREMIDKQVELERERLRIKSGKDLTEARRKMEDLEMKKIFEQRKREKEDEKRARDRVRAEIEYDKQARREKMAILTKSPINDTKTTEEVVSPTTANPESSSSSEIPGKKSANYVKTKIQVRLLNGDVITETFNINEELSAVRLFVQMKSDTKLPFGLMTSYPRKVFSLNNYGETLEQLDLVPSAVLIVTKENPIPYEMLNNNIKLERLSTSITSGINFAEARRKMEEYKMHTFIGKRECEIEDEKRALQRVRDQIEDDKQLRSRKMPVGGKTPIIEKKNDPPAIAAYETNIQIRLLNGDIITKVFNIKEKLSAVRLFVQMNSNLHMPFRLMTSFPRKQFSLQNYNETLQYLNMVPSAVLMVAKGRLCLS